MKIDASEFKARCLRLLDGVHGALRNDVDAV